MSDNGHFDFKKHWLALTPDEREAFAQEAGTTSHYIQTHLTGKRKMPGKVLMNGLFKACNKKPNLVDQIFQLCKIANINNKKGRKN